MKHRLLSFEYHGQTYLVNEAGEIKANGIGRHSPEWVFRGGSRHHWRNGIDVTLAQAFAKPESLNGCYGWDIDHGTTRQWRSQSDGKTSRISGAHLVS